MRVLWLITAVIIACILGCGRQSGAKRDAGDAERQFGYAVTHFWDDMDFTDTLRSRNRLLMERSFVDFISLFPDADAKDIKIALIGFWKKASADAGALELADEITEHYLADPNSPARNEEYYILFIESQLRTPGLPADMLERNRLRLAEAKKNRPGSIATDFTYTDSNGKRNTLLRTPAKRLLLIFYDPACSHCSAILDALHSDPCLQRLIKREELTVLAVYTEGDSELWEKTKYEMPQEWIVAIDESSIVDRDLYILPAMPTLYLLDSDKRILLKDPTTAELSQTLASGNPAPVD